jgi:hypothetical protein
MRLFEHLRTPVNARKRLQYWVAKASLAPRPNSPAFCPTNYGRLGQWGVTTKFWHGSSECGSPDLLKVSTVRFLGPPFETQFNVNENGCPFRRLIRNMMTTAGRLSAPPSGTPTGDQSGNHRSSGGMPILFAVIAVKPCGETALRTVQTDFLPDLVPMRLHSIRCDS